MKLKGVIQVVLLVAVLVALELLQTVVVTVDQAVVVHKAAQIIGLRVAAVLRVMRVMVEQELIRRTMEVLVVLLHLVVALVVAQQAMV